ncbi:MAG: hypothetical protein QM770_18475 [Tepidisphaeraceae bacterium]
MNNVLRLALSYLRQHPARMLLTGLAILSSACMVVWVVSGYDTLLKQFQSFSRDSMGRYSLTVFPARPPGQSGMPAPGQERFVSPAAFEQLRSDPAVIQADPMWAQCAMVMAYDPERFGKPLPTSRPTTLPTSRPTGPGMGGPRGRGGVMLIGTNAPKPPYDIVRGRWIDVTRPDTLEAALSADAADRLGVDLGGEVSAGVGEHAKKLTVVGIVDTPVVPAPASAAARRCAAPAAAGSTCRCRWPRKSSTGRRASVSSASSLIQRLTLHNSVSAGSQG